jgi:hypothetical protein
VGSVVTTDWVKRGPNLVTTRRALAYAAARAKRFNRSGSDSLLKYAAS